MLELLCTIRLSKLRLLRSLTFQSPSPQSWYSPSSSTSWLVCKLLRASFCEQSFPHSLGSVTHGLYRSTFFLFIFTMAVVMKAWFRCVAAAFGDPAPAQTVAGIMLLLLVLYTGYTIPKPSMIGALKWISYINVSGCH